MDDWDSCTSFKFGAVRTESEQDYPRRFAGTILAWDDPSSPETVIQIRTSGCIVSIVASVILTVVVNLLLRSCG